MVQGERLKKQVLETLATVLGVSRTAIKPVRAKEDSAIDAMFSALGRTFAVEVKAATSAASIAWAARRLRESADQIRPPAIPLVVVPFMGEVGQRVCAEAGVSWLDLSGNAHIMADDLRIHFEGRPNKFRAVGRPADVFAPKSARVIRWLLIHADQPVSQRAIARATDMDEGFVSRIVTRLVRENYVVRDERSAVRPWNPGLLLDAWRERYDFSRHHLIRGHVAARSGESLLRSVAETLVNEKVEYAATGLAAAWLFTHFAAFQLTTIYLAEHPSDALLRRLTLREEARGANVWLIIPKDAGVFQGSLSEGGVQCVHPVQTYLDLKAQPERAGEAADRLRAERLAWGRHA
jgi:biotin operon repressor